MVEQVEKEERIQRMLQRQLDDQDEVVQRLQRKLNRRDRDINDKESLIKTQIEVLDICGQNYEAFQDDVKELYAKMDKMTNVLKLDKRIAEFAKDGLDKVSDMRREEKELLRETVEKIAIDKGITVEALIEMTKVGSSKSIKKQRLTNKDGVEE